MSDGAIKVWTLRLDDQPVSASALLRMLDEPERRRSEAFAYPHLRRRYVVAHAALRCVLGEALACAPADVALTRDRNGKPVLVRGGDRVSFNLSHSDDVCAIALSDGRAIGIDIEHQRAMPALPKLVDRHFTAIERRFFFSVDDSDRNHAFFRWWVAKESCLKAIGVGLAFPLNGFSVDFRPGRRLRLLDAPCALENIALAAFDTGIPGCHGMVAVDRMAAAKISVQEWSWGRFHV